MLGFTRSGTSNALVSSFHCAQQPWLPTGTTGPVWSPSDRAPHHRTVTVGGRLALALRAGLGVGVLGVGAGAVGAGWFYTRLLLAPRVQRVYPERIFAADESTVTLAASRLTVQPGVWGLRWPGAFDGSLAMIGEIIRRDDGAVERRLLRGPVPPAGSEAVLDAGPYDPDPSARGLTFEEVDVPTPLGPAPAWVVPAGTGSTWAVMVHGRGGRRREALRVLPAVSRVGITSLVISYRNDEGAPASPDGRYHLGDTEWEDLEAAVQFAVSRGAERIVLVGWSMGAAIIGAFLGRSHLAKLTAAVVWDAPLLDWRATLRQQARNRRLPSSMAWLATAMTSRRIGIDFDQFDLSRNPPEVRPPTLVFHSSGDTVVPTSISRRFAAAAPVLGWPVEYIEVPDVEHTASWNADPEAYETAVTRFLRTQLGSTG